MGQVPPLASMCGRPCLITPNSPSGCSNAPNIMPWWTVSKAKRSVLCLCAMDSPNTWARLIVIEQKTLWIELRLVLRYIGLPQCRKAASGCAWWLAWALRLFLIIVEVDKLVSISHHEMSLSDRPNKLSSFVTCLLIIVRVLGPYTVESLSILRDILKRSV